MSLEKKIAIKKLIISFGLFAIIPLGLLSHVFDPLFDKIYYGTNKEAYNYEVQIAFYTLVIVGAIFLIKKILGFWILKSSNESKDDLPLLNMLYLTLIVTIPILIISGLLDWKFKPISDLGLHFTGVELRAYATNMVVSALKLIIMFMVIRLTQESFEILIPCKYPIPYGGIIFSLSFGIYEIIMGYQQLPIIYFFMGVLFGAIYLLSKRNFKRTYILMLILYFL